MTEDTSQSVQIAVLGEQLRQLTDSLNAMRGEMARDIDRLTARVEGLSDQANRWRGAFWLLLGLGATFSPALDMFKNLLRRD